MGTEETGPAPGLTEKFQPIRHVLTPNAISIFSSGKKQGRMEGAHTLKSEGLG